MKIFTGLLCLVLVCFASARRNQGLNFDPAGDDIDFNDLMITEYPVVDAEFADIQAKNIDEYPYHVAIVTFNKAHKELQIVCQGVLISFDWILTSASCIWSNSAILMPSTTFAVMGTLDYRKSNPTARRLSYYAFHPLFNSTTGKGPDVAMWMLSTSAGLNLGRERVILLEDNPEAPTPSKCVYTTYVTNFLTRNLAKLVQKDNCMEIGIPANNGYCVIMNKMVHEKSHELYELGSPLVCDNKLYATRNAKGSFTTVTDIFPWVVRVISNGVYLNKNGSDGAPLIKKTKTHIRNPRRRIEQPVVRVARIFPIEELDSTSIATPMHDNKFDGQSSSKKDNAEPKKMEKMSAWKRNSNR